MQDAQLIGDLRICCWACPAALQVLAQCGHQRATRKALKMQTQQNSTPLLASSSSSRAAAHMVGLAKAYSTQCSTTNQPTDSGMGKLQLFASPACFIQRQLATQGLLWQRIHWMLRNTSSLKPLVACSHTGKLQNAGLPPDGIQATWLAAHRSHTVLHAPAHQPYL